MKKILFPFEVDNPVYREAYIYAIKFARRLYTEVILLNAFSIEADNDINRETYARKIKEKWFKAYNETVLFNNYYLKDHASADEELLIRFDHHFIHGLLKDEIRKLAREDGIGYIVLPVSDRKEFNKRQLEVITDNIFEKNRISLLVIPFRRIYRPVKNIVFSFDLKKMSGFNQYLEEVLEISRAFDSNIHFLHVTQKESGATIENSQEYREVKQIVDRYPRHILKMVSGKNVFDSVNQYVEDIDADLLVVVKHQYYFPDTLFHRSQSNEISLKSKVPVLVMREKED